MQERAISEIDHSSPTSHSFISQRLRLHYVDWGNAAAPPLILVHGGRDHARSWDWVARALRDDWHIIAPDLRGHGDSAWSPDGVYLEPYLIYDLAQLIHQQGLETVTVIAHSLGSGVALRYAGLYPEKIRKLVAIEGLRPVSGAFSHYGDKPFDQRMREWIGGRRNLSTRSPRRYATIDAALERMRSENSHLSEEQARHLTIHGVSRNEDGTYNWKFDNYMRSWTPLDIVDEELHRLWGRITCPVLLAYGRNSWSTNPAEDGRINHFKNASIVTFEDAGHWPHHDQFDQFMQALRAFL
jgi:pimeloyl-ACP methyl ester carboxylesterase